MFPDLRKYLGTDYPSWKRWWSTTKNTALDNNVLCFIVLMCLVRKGTGLISHNIQCGHNMTRNPVEESLIKSLTAPSALPPCAYSVWAALDQSISVKWLCTCFQQADRPCSQAWVSLVHPADRHWLKCQGLCVCGAPSTGRGLSLRNVRTLNKQWHSSHILYPSVQPDTAWRFDGVSGLYIHTKLLFSSFSAAVAYIFYFCSCFSVSLFRCWFIFFLLPLKFLRDSSCQISFYFPPHNRACCSRPAVNCQRLSEKPGALVMQRNKVQSSNRQACSWEPKWISKGPALA